MRYILSEDVKHILFERFILRESDATDADIANTRNALAQLDTKVSGVPNSADLKKDVEAATAPDVAKVKAAQDAVKEDAWTADVAAVKKNVSDFLKLFIDAITLPGKTAVDAENRLKKFETAWNSYKRLRDIADSKERADLNAPNYSDTNEVTKIKELYNDFRRDITASGIFSHTIDNWPRVKELLDTATKALDDAKKAAVEGLNYLTNEDDGEYELGGLSAETLQTIVKAAMDLTAALPDEAALVTMTADGNIDVVETIKQLEAFVSSAAGRLTSATTAWTEAYTAASEERALNSESDELEKKAAGTTNWANEFAQASKSSNPEAKIKSTWARYWKEEWGPLAQKAQKLGKTFTDILINYGFDEAKNPWISYVKYCLNAGFEMDNTSIIGAQAAYTRGLINNDTLRHKDILSQHKANVLYCADLYSGNNARVVEYLNLQRQITSQYNADLTEVKDKENTFNAKYKNNLLAAYSGSVDKTCLLLTSIFNANYNALTKRATSVSIENATLKDINTAFQEFKACFDKEAKGVSSDKPAINDAGINDIVTRNAGRMPQLITYYIIAFQKETGTKLSKVVADAGFTGLVYPKFDEVEDFGRAFSAYKIDSSNVVTALKKLLTVAREKGIKGFESVDAK